MALVATNDLEGVGLTFPRACAMLIPLEIELATQQIKEALWSVPADVERAKVLISKRMGLRICVEQRSVKLKPAANLHLL
jgi:hypothetical protein